MYDANVIPRMNDLLRHVFIKYFKICSAAEAFYISASWGIRYEVRVQKARSYIKKGNQI